MTGAFAAKAPGQPAYWLREPTLQELLRHLDLIERTERLQREYRWQKEGRVAADPR